MVLDLLTAAVSCQQPMSHVLACAGGFLKETQVEANPIGLGLIEGAVHRLNPNPNPNPNWASLKAPSIDLPFWVIVL